MHDCQILGSVIHAMHRVFVIGIQFQEFIQIRFHHILVVPARFPDLKPKAETHILSRPSNAVDQLGR